MPAIPALGGIVVKPKPSHQRSLPALFCRAGVNMNALAKVLAFAAMVAAAPSAENRGPSPFEVKLEMLGNSEIKATFTNKGNNRLKILRTGSILGNSSVEKAKVFSGGM